MGGLSWIHWLIIIGIVLVVFGGKFKVSDFMGDLGKGIKSFKDGISEPDAKAKELEAQANQTVNSTRDKINS